MANYISDQLVQFGHSIRNAGKNGEREGEEEREREEDGKVGSGLLML